jgi:chromosome segregation ATPase
VTSGHAGATAHHARIRTRGSTTARTPRTERVRERLARIQEDLRRARAAERVLLEQVHYLDGLADDAETRRLTAETPLADRDWRDARTDLVRHTASLEDARRRVADLLAEQDDLLERLFELETATGRRDHP